MTCSALALLRDNKRYNYSTYAPTMGGWVGGSGARSTSRASRRNQKLSEKTLMLSEKLENVVGIPLTLLRKAKALLLGITFY